MENNVESSSSGRPEPWDARVFSLQNLVLLLVAWMTLVVIIFGVLFAYGTATLPIRWSENAQAKKDCRKYQQTTGFETKWVKYSFDRNECMVKLQTPEKEGIKWLPIDSVKVIVTQQVP